MLEHPPIDLSAVGPALWGANWQAQMAAEFNLNDRNIRRWAAAPEEMPRGVRIELNGLIVRRMRLMQERFRTLGYAIHSTELMGETFGNFAEGDDVPHPMPESQVRLRCVDAAARALKHAKSAGEPSAAYIGNVFGLGNVFYSLTKEGDPETAVRCIEAAATAFEHVNGNATGSQQLANECFTAARAFFAFASSRKAEINSTMPITIKT